MKGFQALEVNIFSDEGFAKKNPPKTNKQTKHQNMF